MNGALFYIDWKDQQIFVMEMMGPIIKNAGDARSIGAEIDLSWECLPRLVYFPFLRVQQFGILLPLNQGIRG